MIIIKDVEQEEVLDHWVKVEKLTDISSRKDIVDPLRTIEDLRWSLAKIEEPDVGNIFIISSDDWKQDGLCKEDFKLMTAAQNVDSNSGGKHSNILEKQNIFESGSNILDTKLFLVADNIKGRFTLIEGNKRSVALYRLNKIVGLEVYIAISKAIREYVWARHSYSKTDPI